MVTLREKGNEYRRSSSKKCFELSEEVVWAKESKCGVNLLYLGVMWVSRETGRMVLFLRRRYTVGRFLYQLDYYRYRLFEKR